MPIQEHLAHTRGCPWATSLSVMRNDDDPEPEQRDPLSEDMVESRKATFVSGEGWPHESKKGWKCKIAKMVDAGWCWDPADEGDGVDGVTCFYCGLSLDGWEPKDDPFTEHKRRTPACRYFELLEHFHGVDAANGKIKKSKTTSKGARASTASKASRISTMSAMSAISDVPSMPGSYIDPLDDFDASNVTVATNASQATASGATKGKKKPGRPKASAKGAKGRKKAAEEPVEEDAVQYPDLGREVEEEAPPVKKPKKGTRASKQIDSSVIEIIQSEMVPPKKSTRTKEKAQKGPEPEPEPEVDETQQNPEVSTAGAWAEMRDDFEADDFVPGDESTPAAERVKPKRGVKRTSDGLRKQQAVDSSIVEIDALPQPPNPKRGRPKKASNMSVDSKVDTTANEEVHAAQEDPIEMDSALQPEPPAKKGRGRPKGKKNSTARSSRSSKAKSTASDQDHGADEVEDLARDEMEIEQELERIAAEQASRQAVQEEQEQDNEFEPSPSSVRISKDSAELQKLQDEVEEAKNEEAVPQEDSPPQQPHAPANLTPSPNGSDKENIQSSIIEPSAKQAQPTVVLSPTKTVKIPLAASTPNRSPAKMMHSPSKHVSHLSSTAPWTAIDPDTALIPSLHTEEDVENLDGPDGQLSELLHAAAGDLQSPEKRMTVEEWIRHRAQKGEEELKKRCEMMVSTFEKQGMRALESVHGIQVIT